MENKIILIGRRLFYLDDAPDILGYIFGTVEDAEAYCKKLDKDEDVEERWDEHEWIILDCLNSEKLDDFLNQGQIQV